MPSDPDDSEPETIIFEEPESWLFRLFGLGNQPLQPVARSLRGDLGNWTVAKVVSWTRNRLPSDRPERVVGGRAIR